MGCVPTCGKCPLITRILLLVLLVAIVLTGYLLHEYYLKPWGADTIEDYANSIKSGTTSSNSSSSTTGDVSGHPVDGVACIKCVGVNNIYPVSDRSHPTYGSFQVMVINNGAWVTAVLMIVAVTIGGGGSLIVTLLNAYHGVTVTSTSPTSSTAQNGCGLFEMLFMVSQAQFITMLGSLHLKGSPLFFLKFVKKIAWTNLQIFPIEVDYDPTAVAETTPTITTRSLLSLSTVDSANMTGVERYAVLIGAEPRHLFYYTTLVLAIVLGTVILAYLLLRVLIGLSKKDVAATLDHRVIWVVLQTLLIVQYAVSMTSCFQIYYTATTESQSTGDLGLAIVILAAVCLGVLIFGIVKIARHRDEIKTHGTHEHDELKPFHLRYSVFYLDYNVDNVFFFVGKMVLDITSGAIVGTVQDAPLQIALLIAANGVFLVLLIIRQPYLVPMFYVITVLAGYLRIVMLMLTLVQAKANLFPQDVRDYVAVLTIVINAVLLMCVLARQFYVLSVAIFRWGSRPKNKPVADEELGIPLVEVGDKAPGSKKKSNDKKKDAKPDGGDAKPAEAKAAAPKSGDKKSAEKKASEKKKDKNEIKDSTLFSHQPYHEFNDDDKKKSGSGSGKGGGRRSLYSQKKSQRKQYAPVKDEDLPDWAKV